MATLHLPANNEAAAANVRSQVQAKFTAYGWSNADDEALTEYVLLSLGDGKTKTELANEISEVMEEADKNTINEFTDWMADMLSAQENGNSSTNDQGAPSEGSSTATLQGDPGTTALNPIDAADADMSEVPTGPANVAIPSGPKSMRGTPTSGRGSRGGRASNDPSATLHRIKGTANTGRVNTHSGRDSPRGVPRGPRGGFRGQAGRGGAGFNMQAVQQAAQLPGAIPEFTPEQQNFVQNAMAQQTQMLAHMFAQQQQQQYVSPQGFGVQPHGGGQRGRGRGGRSLFDRVEGGNQRGQQRQGNTTNGDNSSSDAKELTSSMEVETDGQKSEPSKTLCHFNLFCVKPACPFAHQSPAAPPNTVIDMNDDCKFGANCTNRKCAGTHPSPASAASKEPSMCKYWPGCNNPYCSFFHPNAPPCRNGADCPNLPNCTFGHQTTPCTNEPCYYANCAYKHKPGQKQAKDKATAFKSSHWVNPTINPNAGVHPSERKFVDESKAEETIIPGSGLSNQPEQAPMDQEAAPAESMETA